MKFHAGQTYLFPLNDDTQKEHLWVIATEPNHEGLFATVCLSTLRGAKDQTVVFRKSEHPFLKWDTCVLYALAQISSVDILRERIDLESARLHHDAPPMLLRLIFDGFSASDFTKNSVRRFVLEYARALRARAQSAG